MESRVNEIVLYEPIDKERIKAQIFDVRGYKVMLDSDIAVYFGVERNSKVPIWNLRIGTRQVFKS